MIINTKIRYCIIFLFAILVMAGCKKDEENENFSNQLNETVWQKESKNVSGEDLILSDCENNYMMYFEKSGILQTYNACEDKIERSGWSYKGDLLNLSNDLPASYKIDEIGNKLVLTRLDFSNGDLIMTVIKYARVENSLFPKSK